METTIDLDQTTKLNVYYNKKKMTQNQKTFLIDLAKKITNKSNIFTFEFPPTLDKDFLYCSLLFSLKSQNLLQKKLIILANSYEKIQNITNIFSSISRHFNSNQLKIIPYIERKYICINNERLNKSNSYDYDNFCIEQNASWTTEREKCPFYRNLVNYNVQNSLICPPCNIDIEDQIKIFEHQNQMCPFYAYFYNIINDNFDIIICTMKDFFDMRRRISVRKAIKYDDNTDKFMLIYDECNNINETLVRTYSNVVDEEVIKKSRYELSHLKEKINKYSIVNYSMNIDEDEVEELTNIKTEKEILYYSLLVDGKSNSFPGNIRKTNHFLNLLSRLLIFFNKQFSSKNETNWSVYTFEYALLNELWIEFRTLKHLYKRLMYQFHEIKYLKYDEMYHLIKFVIFITHMAIFNDGFIMNYSLYADVIPKQFYIEMLLMEPSNFITKNNNCIFLSGGIGNIDIFSKITKLKVKNYSDDYFEMHNKSNLLLTNTSNTTQSNPSFYGEMLKKLCVTIPDGIVCYFSSKKLMEDYILKWNEQNVFDFILDYKLIFVEESDSSRLSQILTEYKKSCNSGRGALLLLSMRNKASLLDELYGHYSRGIIFLGFPIETKVNKILDFTMEYHIKQFEIDNEVYMKYDAMKLFSSKIVNKIQNSSDKKILIFLAEKLLSEKVKDYLPLWLRNMIHSEKEEDTNNVDDRIKLIPQFLMNN